MSADLMPFALDDVEVRVYVRDGEPWFIAADVARVLGYSSTAAMTRSVDDDDKGLQTVHTPGGVQTMVIISEPGLYVAVVGSRVPGARRFKHWITHEVVPAIRRTGSYNAAPALPDITTPAGVLAMAEQFAATARELVASTQRIAELEPRAEVADRLLDADGDLSVADAAKALTRAGIDTGATRLFKALERLCWTYRGRSDGRWHVYQAAIEARYMAVIPQSHYHPKTGELVMDAPQPRVTPKGLERLMRELTPAPDLQLVTA